MTFKTNFLHGLHRKTMFFSIAGMMFLTGCAGITDRLTKEPTIDGVITGSVQPGAEKAPKRFLIINGEYGDTLKEKHLLQTSKNPLTQTTYDYFNYYKRFVQLILNDAGWEEVSPEQFLKDKSNVTIISINNLWHTKPVDWPAIFTASDKTKFIAADAAKGLAKGIGGALLKKAAGVEDSGSSSKKTNKDHKDYYFHLTIGAFKTTAGDDKAIRPTEAYWKTIAYIKQAVPIDEEGNTDFDTPYWERLMPMLATMIKPHLGQEITEKKGMKTSLPWPNREIAALANHQSFYDNLKCDYKFLFFGDLKSAQKTTEKSLARFNKRLAKKQEKAPKNKFLAAHHNKQVADIQQDVWSNEMRLASLNKVIEEKDCK